MPVTITSFPANLCHVRNPIEVVAQADSAWATHTSYEMRVSLLYFRTSSLSSLTNLVTLRAQPDQGGVMRADLARYGESLVRATPPDPTQLLQLSPDMRKAVLIRVEEWIDGVVANVIEGGRFITIMRGGMDSFAGQSVYSWITDRTDGYPFLTREPVKRAWAGMDQWAYFPLLPGLSGDITLRADYTLNDGTTQQAVSLDVFSDPYVSWDLLAVPCGPTQIGLPAGVVEYEVYITLANDAAPFSQRLIFEMEQKRYPQERLFLYENSLGGWETVVAYGQQQRSQVVRQTSARRLLGSSPPRHVADQVAANTSRREMVQVAMGLRNAAETVHMTEELTFTENVLLQEGDDLTPLALDNQEEIPIISDDPLESNAKIFTFRRARLDRGFRKPKN